MPRKFITLKYNSEYKTHKYANKNKILHYGWCSQDHIPHFIVFKRLGAKNSFIKI